MTKKQQDFFKVQREQSEIRSRLGEIRMTPEDQINAELRTERTALEGRFRTVETEFRTALDELQVEQTAGATPDAEARALRSLTGRASMGAIFESVVEQRKLDHGPTAELQEHFKVGPHAVPIAMLREEHRAITPAATNVGVDEQPVVEPVFALGDAAFLAVDQVTVPSGEAVFPVLTSRPAVGGPHTGSQAVAETTGAFSAESLPPGRLQASFFYLRTDSARFAGMSESLRSALSMGLSESLDQKVIAQIVTDVGRTDRGSVSDWAHYKSLVTGQVDGRFAASEADLKVVMGTPTFVHASKAYRANETAESGVDAMRSMSGGVRVSVHIPGPASSKQDVIVRRGMRRDAVIALWPSVDLILDEISGQKKGEITVTGVLLGAFKVLRAGAFARLQTQHA